VFDTGRKRISPGGGEGEREAGFLKTLEELFRYGSIHQDPISLRAQREKAGRESQRVVTRVGRVDSGCSQFRLKRAPVEDKELVAQF
jgi:hypothetical protein